LVLLRNAAGWVLDADGRGAPIAAAGRTEEWVDGVDVAANRVNLKLEGVGIGFTQVRELPPFDDEGGVAVDGLGCGVDAAASGSAMQVVPVGGDYRRWQAGG